MTTHSGSAPGRAATCGRSASVKGAKRRRRPHAPAGEHRGAGAAHLPRQLDEQAGLAAAGLAGEHHDPRRARARPPPGVPQHGELLAPADQGRVLAARERARQEGRGVRVEARRSARSSSTSERVSTEGAIPRSRRSAERNVS